MQTSRRTYGILLAILGILLFLYLARQRVEGFQEGSENIDKNIIIYQPWGGLGDNLQFTTLPELYSKHGYNVYISSDNAYRSDELYDLIWKLNPYVKGVSELPKNAGDSKETKHETTSYIKNIEIAHGFQDGYRKYPVIYYKPKHIEGIDNYIFYDPTSVSSNVGSSEYAISFQSVFNKYPNMIPCRIVFKKNYKGVDKETVQLPTVEVYEIENIEHFCDVIYSCKVLVVTFSGAAVLASAIKQDSPTPEVYSFYTEEPTIFKFDNIIYSKTIKE